ncbi:5-oxoprolinase subunit PxpB [Pseudomonadota bacterium AL_CKDN230030165-1A_HGKHYDSX7]
MPESSHTSSPTETAWRILPQGDRCLVIELGDTISEAVGQQCLGLAQALRDAAWPGVTDVVPSFTKVAVHYRPLADGSGPTFDSLRTRIEARMQEGIVVAEQARREVNIPVCYGGEHGPDLDDVARAAGLSPQAVIDLHTQPGAMVYMLGFAPGHAYIGVHDERLSIGRRDTPRAVVPIGSVAIANRQSVIYPNRLPGGWNIIGATPLTMFDPAREPAALLQPGDRIRFVPIDQAEFDRLRGQDTP